MMKELKQQRISIILIVLTILYACFFQTYLRKEHNQINAESINYEKAKVVEITKQDLTYNDKLKINLGIQKLKVKILEGDKKGEVISVDNYVTAEHNVETKIGTKLIMSIDEPDKIEPYYSVYNYDRSFILSLCVLVLFITIIAIGKGKGVKAIAGLAYSLFLIIAVLLPSVFSGYSPIVMSIICAFLSTVVTLLLLNGNSVKTYSAIVSTILGVLVALLFFLITSSLTNINGFSTSEAEGLILIGQNTGLQIKDVLFVGVLISSLGAIMDVGMSIVSALFEVHHHSPNLSTKELFKSGIEIGKDMIGTMSNTLILAFTGSAFITLLVFLSYQIEMNQLLNSNYLTIEILQGICGTLGIVITVPLASWITSMVLTHPVLKTKLTFLSNGKN